MVGSGWRAKISRRWNPRIKIKKDDRIHNPRKVIQKPDIQASTYRLNLFGLYAGSGQFEIYRLLGNIESIKPLFDS
jgi:hypothetical protein